MDTSSFISFKEKVVSNCSKVILGKEKITEKIAVCFLCGGHVLLEDVPGTGKTVLLRAFSKSIGGDFKRIQFTPDVMPSDVTGINFYNRKTNDFELRKGPVFADIVLADEINRATPRTQSSLLEAMAEGQVSLDGETYALPANFMVAATQNPLESYGTFPLPEAQLDRFFMRLSLGYMNRKDEIDVMQRESSSDILKTLQPVVTAEEIALLKKEYRLVKVNKAVSEYIMDIIEATRTNGNISIGASTRGAIALCEASRVYAAFQGRDFVIPEDVKELAAPVLRHRLTYRGLIKQSESSSVFDEILSNVAVPTEEMGR